jgi:hypothetical protein
VLEALGTIPDQNFSILIDASATERFISIAMLKRIKVMEFEEDEFKYVEMETGAKKKVGGNIKGCSINLGDFVTKVDLYVTILGSYDLVIGMDRLESHDAILDCNMKQLRLKDDL